MGEAMLMVTPVEGEEQAVLVRTGDSRKIGIVGSGTPQLSLHRTFLKRLGLWEDFELLADLEASTTYHVDGAEGTITMEAEIELPLSGFDPMELLCSPEKLDLEQEPDVERLPDDPPALAQEGPTR